MEIYVQFSDEKEETIIEAFSCPQPEDVYPNQGVVEDSDSRYVEFLSRFNMP